MSLVTRKGLKSQSHSLLILSLTTLLCTHQIKMNTRVNCSLVKNKPRRLGVLNVQYLIFSNNFVNLLLVLRIVAKSEQVAHRNIVNKEGQIYFLRGLWPQLYRSIC